MLARFFHRLSGTCLATLFLSQGPARAESVQPLPVLAVTASSTAGMLMDAVDGDPATAWHNRQAGEPSAWLGIHFEAPALVSVIVLNTGPLEPGVVFDVGTSLDGTDYQPALKGQRVGQDGDVTFNFTPRPALYLRVTFRYTAKNSAPGFQIREIEALGLPSQ